MGISLFEHFFPTILAETLEKHVWKFYVVSNANLRNKFSISIPILRTVQELS